MKYPKTFKEIYCEYKIFIWVPFVCRFWFCDLVFYEHTWAIKYKQAFFSYKYYMNQFHFWKLFFFIVRFYYAFSHRYDSVSLDSRTVKLDEYLTRCAQTFLLNGFSQIACLWMLLWKVQICENDMAISLDCKVHDQLSPVQYNEFLLNLSWCGGLKFPWSNVFRTHPPLTPISFEIWSTIKCWSLSMSSWTHAMFLTCAERTDLQYFYRVARNLHSCSWNGIFPELDKQPIVNFDWIHEKLLPI